MSNFKKLMMAPAGGGGEPWEMSGATWVATYLTSSTETRPNGVNFKPDGTKMYLCGNRGFGANGSRIWEYNLSTAWDITTASLFQYLSIPDSSGVARPGNMHFKPDGTRLYFMSDATDKVAEYSLSTAWNVSTASLTRSFSVNSQDGAPTGLTMKNDGTKMYITGRITDRIHEYNLSTAWNVSTASILQNKSVSAQDNNPYGLFLKPDGTSMYMVGARNQTAFNRDAAYQYNLSTANNITTASFATYIDLVLSGSDYYLDDAKAITFSPDGVHMYLCGGVSGFSTPKVQQFILASE